jgi:alcohol dehydrogenase class IV
VHALSFILSEEWHVPHGVACAFTLEDVFQLNLKDEKTRQRLVRVAQSLFGERHETELLAALLSRIIALKKKFGLPFTFKNLNIEFDKEDVEALFCRSLDDPKMRNNSMEVDRETIFELIKRKL